MKRWSSLIAVSALLATPVVLAVTHTQSIEDAAWGASTPKKPARKAAKRSVVRVKELPTVDLHTKAAVKPGHLATPTVRPVAHRQKPGRFEADQTPGVPADFGAPSEGAAYQKDADDKQQELANTLAKLYHQRPVKSTSGLAAAIQLQTRIDKALKDENLTDPDRLALRTLLDDRDAAFYMLSASLVAQKKEYAAQTYLKFLAKTADPGTPLRDAAVQQLAQLGVR